MTISSLDTDPVAELAPPPRRARRNVLAPLLAAVQFLTILPPLIRRAFTPAELGWSLAFFPLVGALVGGILVALDLLVGVVFPPNLSTALVLASWVLLTGGLHLDGFLDTCDGLLGGRTPEDRLRIMRDERVGAYAVIGGILLILVKFNALLTVPDRTTALFLAPILGRWSMVLAVIAFPYARLCGLGRDMKDNAGLAQLLLATITVLPAVFWLAGWLGLFAVGLVLAGVLVAGWFVLRRLPGFTGDIYGCFCELAEVLVLLTLIAGTEA